MKKSLVFLLLAMLLCVAAACSQEAPPDSDAATPSELPILNVAVLRGPTGVAAAWLMEQAENGMNNYRFHLADNPDQVVAMLTSNTVDVAAMPSNLAANMYAKTEGQIQMAAIITTGMLYILQAGNSMQHWEDLHGATIYATARGSSPEYILDFLLSQHGLHQQLNIDVEFLSEHAELATLLAAGQVGLGMLPEPFVTSALMQNEDLSIMFDLSAEWESLGFGNLAMTALAVRQSFAAANSEAVVAFLEDMEESINFAVNNTAEAADLCVKHDIIPNPRVAGQAIPRCNLTFIAGESMKGAISDYFDVLYLANPQAIGGSLPDEKFYFIPQ